MIDGICLDGYCHIPCEEVPECPGSTVCEDGVCALKCEEVPECPENTVCEDGVCALKCEENSQCLGHQKCDVESESCVAYTREEEDTITEQGTV